MSASHRAFVCAFATKQLAMQQHCANGALPYFVAKWRGLSTIDTKSTNAQAVGETFLLLRFCEMSHQALDHSVVEAHEAPLLYHLVLPWEQCQPE